MTNRHSTKRAFFASVMALILCFTMLLGTTYAWFTDTVTSSNNKIQAGTLIVDLSLFNEDTGNYESIKEDKDPIFNYDKWEPGYTDVKLLKVENKGTLALKWMARFVSAYELSALADVIDVYVLPSANELAMPTDRNLTGYNKVGTVKEFVNTIETTTTGTLEAGKSAYLGIALKMREEAGNEYQGLSIKDFDIQILATQLTFEKDSIDNQYDFEAAFPGASGKGSLNGSTALELDIKNNVDEKVGSAVIPAEALAGETATVTFTETDYEGNFTVAANETATTFDITVTGLKEGNTAEVKITARIETGLDPATVKVYHYNTLIDSSYDPATGLITFQSATFSPFTAVRDVKSVYVAPVIPAPEEPEEGETPALPAGIPTANVTKYDLANTPGYSTDPEVKWEKYGSWSPTEGLDSKLEAAYVFACTETLDEAKENPFANWHCDFYVKLNKDLAANQIFLGGNYGDFGWVGFHNGDLTLNANTEIALLGSVTKNPWTYVQVVQNVREFICGVGDVEDALADATFTVMLRLTNPDNAEEYYNIETIEYTFAKTVTTGEELQDAINNGSQNIVLGGDIDLSEGLVIPGN